MLVHDLGDADDLAVVVADGHADEGLGAVPRPVVDLRVETGVLEKKVLCMLQIEAQFYLQKIAESQSTVESLLADDLYNLDIFTRGKIEFSTL